MPVYAQPIPAPAPLAMQPAPAPVLHDVHLQPVAPRAQQYAEPQIEPRMPELQPQPSHFIPPAPEQPIRGQRMPKFDELPLPAQVQLRAQRSTEDAEMHSPETKRRTLLDRLAAFGMSRQDDSQAASQPQQAAPAVRPSASPARGMAPAPNQVHAEYAKRPPVPGARPTPAPLDPHGRLAPQTRSAEEDQLEIPAFLRRQSN